MSSRLASVASRSHGNRLAVGASLLAPLLAAGAQLPLELPVSPELSAGLCTAEVAVGTPPQRVRVAIDSASEWLWLTSAEIIPGGFSQTDSVSFEEGAYMSFAYMDGLAVKGNSSLDAVTVGQLELTKAPLLLARNFSGPDVLSSRGFGLIGLGVPLDSEEVSPEEKLLKGFFGYLWQSHPEVPRTYRLELGGSKPRMLVGDRLEEGLLADGGVRFLKDSFTRRTSNWYVSVRAIGLSRQDGAEAGWLTWSLDFNQFSAFGLPALLDSGSAAIRLGVPVFERLRNALPRGCKKTVIGGLDCPCEGRQGEFPTISISFEVEGNYRFLGLDAGRDHIACVSPSSYVRASQTPGRCMLAIIEAERSQIFGHEAIVLGVPFFQSVTVAYDLERRRVALGPSLALDAQPDAHGPARPREELRCADPKSLWSTGHRFSPFRFTVVFAGAGLIIVYIFVKHSTRSDCFRSLFSAPLAARAPTLGGRGDARPRTTGGDRPFVELASGTHRPE